MAESVVHELARQRIGRILKGKWVLEELLGYGGMAAVYGARHRNGAKVAIKMLHATVSGSAELRARFVREGYLVNRVDHPAVVRVLDDDVCEVDGCAFLVMERANGVSLCDRAQERLLDEREALEVAEQVLEALVVAHGNGVIHRDLKPDNLLVDERGRVRLLDFGIARLLDDDDANAHTRTGLTFGTPGYMAPEQALGRRDLISPRTDLYALGATLFTLVTGESIHPAESSQELLIKVATQPARSVGRVMPSLSSDFVELVDRATRLIPDSRWESAEQMLSEVRRILAARGALIAEAPASQRKISSRVAPIEIGPKLEIIEPKYELETLHQATRPSLVRREMHASRRRRVYAVVLSAVSFFLVATLRPTAPRMAVASAEADEPAIERPATPPPVAVPVATIAKVENATTKALSAPRPAITVERDKAHLPHFVRKF